MTNENCLKYIVHHGRVYSITFCDDFFFLNDTFTKKKYTLSSYSSDSFFHDGFYISYDYNRNELRCLDLRTQEIRWHWKFQGPSSNYSFGPIAGTKNIFVQESRKLLVLKTDNCEVQAESDSSENMIAIFFDTYVTEGKNYYKISNQSISRKIIIDNSLGQVFDLGSEIAVNERQGPIRLFDRKELTLTHEIFPNGSAGEGEFHLVSKYQEKFYITYHMFDFPLLTYVREFDSSGTFLSEKKIANSGDYCFLDEKSLLFPDGQIIDVI